MQPVISNFTGNRLTENHITALTVWLYWVHYSVHENRRDVSYALSACAVLLQEPLPMETTPLTMVSTEEQLMKLCEILKTQNEIAVDTEVSNVMHDDDDYY